MHSYLDKFVGTVSPHISHNEGSWVSPMDPIFVKQHPTAALHAAASSGATLGGWVFYVIQLLLL